ncbi:hypothetical protein POM88_007993 [Heracleum sosnowskyi]|uniref:Replication factor A C-terminal domain-containing protein n=1 Tax=Heracleum sosnowskyi TaxID=360622 RepID=A0AAD8N1B9_9APIA|nr:hypothetical protein POM88_007993 [Heracleum sosnowskyi]
MELNMYNPIDMLDTSTYHWKLKKDLGDGLIIEEFAFYLLHMGDIDKLADDNKFLIDMVGRLENLQPKIRSNKNESKTMLKFELFDGRVYVTLFDEFGDKVGKELEKLENEDIYIIIACAKAGRYDAKPNLTNYPATRVYINPKHYSVEELKIKMGNMSSIDIGTPEKETPKVLLTVKEIKELKSDFKDAKVNCEVTVKKIDDETAWYYAKCTNCEKELFPENGRFYCSSCNRIIPHPDKMFRVCMICSDRTGSIAIVFPDEEVTRIIGKTVFDIQVECLEEDEMEQFLDILKQLKNQQYTITIEIQEQNIKKGSIVYEATEITEPIDCRGSVDPGKNQAMKMEKETIQNDRMEETPQTENSTNMKLRDRKNIHPVPYDTNEDVLLRQLKNIKKEKADQIYEISLCKVKKNLCSYTHKHKFKLASNKYEKIANLKPGRYDYKIKVRVIRLWRVFTRRGEELKCFNVMLIDSKKTRIHAFIPTTCAEQNEKKLKIGYVCNITNFTVQPYKPEEKFRCLRNDKQLIFSKDTIIEQIDDKSLQIPQDDFDFYDHSELMALTKQTTYLADVVGIIKTKFKEVNKVQNRLGKDQCQAKFTITDGKLKKPEFLKQIFAKPGKKITDLITIEDVKKLSKEVIQRQVLTHVKVDSVEQTKMWYSNYCTCQEKTGKVDEYWCCTHCKKIVPHPLKKFKIIVIASDETGKMKVVLGDQQVRMLTGTRARQLLDKLADSFFKFSTSPRSTPSPFSIFTVHTAYSTIPYNKKQGPYIDHSEKSVDIVSSVETLAAAAATLERT